MRAPENTVAYLLDLWQYIILALVFNKGHPHRKELYTNYSLVCVLVAQVSFVLYSMFSIDWFNTHVQELEGTDGVVTYRFRCILLGLALTNGVVAFLADKACRPLLWLIENVKSAMLSWKSRAYGHNF